MCRCDRIVESRKDARRPFRLNQVAHNLVVEVLDGRPLDLLLSIFFLLLLECQLDKDLLELLIYIVDAQLLERVVFKDFKAVNVQHSNHGGRRLTLCLQRSVDPGDNPVK